MTEKLIPVPRELLERALKADHAPGRSATELCDGWKALDELETLLAQPASEPKPVGRINKTRSGLFVDLFEECRNLPDEALVFAHPAPAVVVLPHDWEEKLHAEMKRRFELSKRDDHWLCIDDTQIGVEFASDWVRACLDEVARLNK